VNERNGGKKIDKDLEEGSTHLTISHSLLMLIFLKI
jgi:hypothetical protein